METDEAARFVRLFLFGQIKLGFVSQTVGAGFHARPLVILSR